MLSLTSIEDSLQIVAGVSERGISKDEELNSQLLRRIVPSRGGLKRRLLDWAVSTTHERQWWPLAAEQRVNRLGSEEAGVHRVWRYIGADPTRELNFKLNAFWLRKPCWRVSRMKENVWENFCRPPKRRAASLSSDWSLEALILEKRGQQRWNLPMYKSVHGLDYWLRKGKASDGERGVNVDDTGMRDREATDVVWCWENWTFSASPLVHILLERLPWDSHLHVWNYV